MADQLALSLGTRPGVYRQRGVSGLQRLYRARFPDLHSRYDDELATRLGKVRVPRITRDVERFLNCGDRTKGIARIKCTNPDCKSESFRPFSRKVFQLCPSCSQERPLLFGENANERLLLRLPRRQIVFTFPKVLRSSFRHDHYLHGEASKLVYRMMRDAHRRRNARLFSALEFLVQLMQHLPDSRIHLVHRHGLYSPRSRGTWAHKPWLVRLAPQGCVQQHAQQPSPPPQEALELNSEPTVSPNGSRSAFHGTPWSWARLLAKVCDGMSSAAAAAGRPRRCRPSSPIHRMQGAQPRQRPHRVAWKGAPLDGFPQHGESRVVMALQDEPHGRRLDRVIQFLPAEARVSSPFAPSMRPGRTRGGLLHTFCRERLLHRKTGGSRCAVATVTTGARSGLSLLGRREQTYNSARHDGDRSRRGGNEPCGTSRCALPRFRGVCPRRAACPRHFFLFLIFFLGLQVVSFALSAFTVESRAGFRLPSIPIFVLEDTMHAVSALLIWYVPRFLSVSFGLDYPRLKKRVFLGLLVLIGAAKIVTVNAQAFAYWSDSFDRLARVAFAVEDLAVMPVFYAWFVYLVASAARALRRSDAAHRKPYFWGPWFLFALAFLLLADLAERALADPFLADVTGTVPSPIVGFPFLSLAGLCMGLTVVLRAVASLRRTFAMATADAAPSRDDRLSGFGLTPRELEIARLLVRGRVNKEIAVALDISYGTVKNHAYSLYQKLHITSRFELIRLLEEKSPSEAQTP